VGARDHTPKGTSTADRARREEGCREGHPAAGPELAAGRCLAAVESRVSKIANTGLILQAFQELVLTSRGVLRLRRGVLPGTTCLQQGRMHVLVEGEASERRPEVLASTTLSMQSSLAVAGSCLIATTE